MDAAEPHIRRPSSPQPTFESGRRDAIEAITSAIARLDHGQGGVLAIGGERGSGRTHLLDFARRRARRVAPTMIHVDIENPLDISTVLARLAAESSSSLRPAVLITVDDVGDLAPTTRAIVTAARPRLGSAACLWLICGETRDVSRIGVAVPLQRISGLSRDDAAAFDGRQTAATLPRQIVESAQLLARDNDWGAEWPESLTQRLSESDAEALRAGALLGNSFDPADLAAVLDRPVVTLAPMFEAAIGAGILVVAPAQMRFTHPLVAQALLPESEDFALAAMRRRVIDRLSSTQNSSALAEGARTGRLGFHDIDPSRALELCVLISGTDPSTAAAAASDVAARMSETTRDVAMGLAATYRLQSGDPLALTDYLPHLDSDQLAMSTGPAMAFAITESTFAAFNDKARELAEHVLAASPLDSRLRARLASVILLADTYRGQASDGDRVRVARVVSESVDPRAEALLRLALALHESERGDLGAGLREASLPTPLPAGGDAGPAWWMASIYRTRLLADLGRVDEAEGFLRAVVDAAEHAGQGRAIPSLMMMTGILRMESGSLNEAVTYLEAARQLAAGMALPGLVETNCVNLLTRIYRMTGDAVILEDLHLTLEHQMAEDEARRETAVAGLMFADDALGVAYGVDRWDAWASRPGASLRHYWIAWGLSDTIASFRLAHQHGRHDRTEELARSLQILSSNTESSLLTAAVRHTRGVLRSDPDSIARAQSTYIDLGRPLLAAQAAEDLAWASSDNERRQSGMREAESAWASIGARREAARIEQVLRDMGVRSAGQQGGFGVGLSAAEERVVRAVASGATNKQIAQSLFISPNTVAVHLRRIFAKTGARSRTDLAQLAQHWGHTASVMPEDGEPE